MYKRTSILPMLKFHLNLDVYKITLKFLGPINLQLIVYRYNMYIPVCTLKHLFNKANFIKITKLHYVGRMSKLKRNRLKIFSRGNDDSYYIKRVSAQ